MKAKEWGHTSQKSHTVNVANNYESFKYLKVDEDKNYPDSERSFFPVIPNDKHTQNYNYLNNNSNFDYQQSAHQPYKNVHVTEDGIQKMVDIFLVYFSHKYQYRFLPQAMVNDICTWLCTQLQQERMGWKDKLQHAFSEVEINRHKAMVAEIGLSEVLGRIKDFVESNNLLQNMYTDDSGMQRHSVQDNFESMSQYDQLLVLSDILMDNFNRLIQDQSKCLKILKVRNVTNPCAVSVARFIQSNKSTESFTQETEWNRKQESFEQTIHKLEDELRKTKEMLKSELDHRHKIEHDSEKKHNTKRNITQLEADRMRLRRLLNKKEDYSEWLKKHLMELIELLGEEPSDIKTSRTEKKSMGQFKQDKLNMLKHFKSEGEKFDMTITPDLKSENMASEPNYMPELVEISAEKLDILKKKAKQLEASLDFTLKQMNHMEKEQHSTAVHGNMETASIADDADKTPDNHFLNSDKNIERKKNVQESAEKHNYTAFNFNQQILSRKDHKGRSTVANQSTSMKILLSLNGGKTNMLGGGRKGKVTKCFRCRKLFRVPENHKLACCYHTKGKERIEKYDEDGKLLQVQFEWICCHKGADIQGCCFGPHV